MIWHLVSLPVSATRSETCWCRQNPDFPWQDNAGPMMFVNVFHPNDPTLAVIGRRLDTIRDPDACDHAWHFYRQTGPAGESIIVAQNCERCGLTLTHVDAA